MPFTKKYTRLKKEVDSAFDLRKSLSLQSQAAYKSGNGALAKELSIKAKDQYVVAQKHKAKFDRYVASYDIFEDSDNDSIEGCNNYGQYYHENGYSPYDNSSNSNYDSDNSNNSDNNSDYEVPKYDANEDPIYQSKKYQLDSAYRTRESLSLQSQQFFKTGQCALAKEYSERAKLQLRKAENLKKELTDYTFSKYNYNRTQTDGGEAVDYIDLHGLYVEEAKNIFISKMKSLRNNSSDINYCSLSVVVGRGNHSSKNGTALIKGAIESICRRQGWSFRYQYNNDGELLVDI